MLSVGVCRYIYYKWNLCICEYSETFEILKTSCTTDAAVQNKNIFTSTVVLDLLSILEYILVKSNVLYSLPTLTRTHMSINAKVLKTDTFPVTQKKGNML